MDEGVKPLLVRFQIGVFHFDRAGVVGQHVEEHPPKDAQLPACRSAESTRLTSSEGSRFRS